MKRPMIAKIAHNSDTVIFQNPRQRSRANSSVRLFLDIKTALFLRIYFVITFNSIEMKLFIFRNNELPNV